MNRSSSLANIGIKRDTSTEPEKRNRDERSSLNSKVPGHTMSHKTLDTGDQKSHVCISERTSSKFEIGTLPNSVNSLTKPALVVTISPGKVGNKSQKQADNTGSCNTSIMDYIKNAQSHWALKKPSLDKKSVTEKNKVHIAYLKSELKKNHKKLNSICRKEASDLLEVSPRTDEETKNNDQRRDSLKQPKKVSKTRNGRTYAEAYRSPQLKNQRPNISGTRKTSIPIDVGLSYSKTRKVRPSVTKQLNISPHREKRDSGAMKEKNDVEAVENGEKVYFTKYIQTRLETYNHYGKPSKLLASKKSQAWLNSLEDKKQKFIDKITSQAENQTFIEERLEKWQSKPRESNTTCSGGVDSHRDRCMERPSERRQPPRAEPILVQQATCESLVSNNQPTLSPKLEKPISQKEKVVMFDHKLNSRFKMLDFFEQDESLIDARKGYREKLKEFKKATNLTNNDHDQSKVIVKTHTDHEKLENYCILEDLGEGSFAKVKLAQTKATGEHVAMKIYEHSHNVTDALKKNMAAEIKLLQVVKHPNIIKLLEWFEGKWFTYLVLDFAGRLNLLDYLEKSENKSISEDEAVYIFRMVGQALSHLHSKKIAHRDIKLDNIMLGPSGEVKLIDFGFGVKVKKDQKFDIYCGTPSYMAPEILSKAPYYPLNSDVWAFGICLYRSLVGRFPFRGISAENLFHVIKKGHLTLPAHLSADAASILKQLLSKKPSLRPDFDEVLNHPWFKNAGNFCPKFAT